MTDENRKLLERINAYANDVLGEIDPQKVQVSLQLDKLRPIMEEIAEERSDIVVGKINVDEQPELASRFGIMSIPTLMVMKDGEIVRKATGAKPKKVILGMLG